MMHLARIWGALPTTHSPMMDPAYYIQTGRKYVRRNAPLTDELLASHVAGDCTLAAPLIGADGLARCWAVEIDAGGMLACAAALDAAQLCGLVAVAFVVEGANGHNGGHVWSAPYATGYDPARLRAQARQVVAAAQLPAETETYPTGADLRLPFGQHTHTGQRGKLRLQDGTIYDLDTPEGLAAGWAIWAALSFNTLPPPTIEPEIRVLGAPRPVQLDSGSTIRSWARNIDLVALLEGYGAKQARSQPKGGGTLMHCPCRGHPHGDKRASLLVKPGHDGTPCVIGYAPGCAYAAQPGKRYDAGSVVCHQEGISYKDLHQRISGGRPTPTPVQEPRALDPPPTPTPEQLAARAADAERKRNARQATAAETLASARAHLNSDQVISLRAGLVVAELLAIAGDRDWCRPSNAQLAERLGISVRSVRYGLAEAEARGYFCTTRYTNSAGEAWSGGKGTAIRTFLRWQENTSSAFVYAAESRSCDLDMEESACEAGGVALPSVPVGALISDTGVRYAPYLADSARCPASGAEDPHMATSAEDPQMPPAPIAEPGGASYDPAADWTVRPATPAARPGRTLPTEAARRRIAEQERQRQQQEWERQQAERAAAAAAEQAQLLDQADAGDSAKLAESPDLTPIGDKSAQRMEMPPAAPAYGPPSDPATRRHYYALLGRARNASSAKQRRYLEGLARELEEPHATPVSHVGEVSPGGRVSAPRFTSQLPLRNIL